MTGALMDTLLNDQVLYVYIYVYIAAQVFINLLLVFNMDCVHITHSVQLNLIF